MSQARMPHDQSTFRAALLDPDASAPLGLLDGAGRPAGKRFDVYRNNVTVALVEALQASFPVLNKLLGPQNFDQLAALFARMHAPTSPLMMHYGADMPVFLEAFQPLAHIGYLPDIARLELALRRAYHAADAPAFDPARLARVPPDTLMQSRLRFAPAVQLIPSQWPLVDIWRYNMVQGAPKPHAQAQSALITRAEFDPQPYATLPEQAAWLRAALSDATLAEAHDRACAINPDFDLAPLLALLIEHNAIADFTTPKE